VTFTRSKRILLVVLLMLYISSYFGLSRRAFRMMDTYNAEGLYFFKPKDTVVWRIANYGCVTFYYPLIALDVLIGTGRPPAAEPAWGIGEP